MIGKTTIFCVWWLKILLLLNEVLKIWFHILAQKDKWDHSVVIMGTCNIKNSWSWCLSLHQIWQGIHANWKNCSSCDNCDGCLPLFWWSSPSQMPYCPLTVLKIISLRLIARSIVSYSVSPRYKHFTRLEKLKVNRIGATFFKWLAHMCSLQQVFSPPVPATHLYEAPVTWRGIAWLAPKTALGTVCLALWHPQVASVLAISV